MRLHREKTPVSPLAERVHVTWIYFMIHCRDWSPSMSKSISVSLRTTMLPQVRFHAALCPCPARDPGIQTVTFEVHGPTQFCAALEITKPPKPSSASRYNFTKWVLLQRLRSVSSGFRTKETLQIRASNNTPLGFFLVSNISPLVPHPPVGADSKCVRAPRVAERGTGWILIWEMKLVCKGISWNPRKRIFLQTDSTGSIMKDLHCICILSLAFERFTVVHLWNAYCVVVILDFQDPEEIAADPHLKRTYWIFWTFLETLI